MIPPLATAEGIALSWLRNRIVARRPVVRRFSFSLLHDLDPSWGFSALLGGLLLLLFGLWFREDTMRIPEPAVYDYRDLETRCPTPDPSHFDKASVEFFMFREEFERTPFGRLGEVNMFSPEGIEKAALEREAAQAVPHP